MGQTMLAQDDVAGAKALYQKTLAPTAMLPGFWPVWAMLTCWKEKRAEARQMFDAAIAASKGKKGTDPAILTAVARANVQAYTDQKKVGDLDYAINLAERGCSAGAQQPRYFCGLGNAYRKLHKGGEAVQAYRKAGNYAPALYRVASLYQSQRNWDVVVENLNSAIAADPRFAPASLICITTTCCTKKILRRPLLLPINTLA
jgi:tetratricopeptide (TPR) repeat protein